MSDKSKKHKFAEKRENRRLKRLAEEGRLVNGVELPHGAIIADHSKQMPNDYFMKPEYYMDVEFTCKDCGSKEVWTAEQQKWYYEVAQGSLYQGAVRCRGCRNKRKDERELQHQRIAESEQIAPDRDA